MYIDMLTYTDSCHNALLKSYIKAGQERFHEAIQK